MTHLDETFEPVEPQDDVTAAWLDRHFGLHGVVDDRITAAERAAIRARVFGAQAPSFSRSTGIVAGPFAALPAWGRSRAQRVASLAAAAALVLILVAALGGYLRSDSGERLPGAAATASVLPFAPGAALASPAAATCATDATLLLVPSPDADTAAFAELPFAVAWDREGTLVVQRGDVVLHEIALPEGALLRPTSQPGVILAAPIAPDHRDEPARLINIETGESAEVGPYRYLHLADGPYAFWASDSSYTRWSVTDLRTFETVDLSEHYRPEPLAPWVPSTGSVTTSDDGTVVLAGTTSSNPSNETPAPATPLPSDLPPLEVSHNAILIDGSLDNIRLVGPLATTSGAMALSPDGKMVAWIAPSDRAGVRFLEIQDVATGDEITGQPIDATYSISLLFSADGEYLYVTEGRTLRGIDLDLANGYELGNTSVELPDTAYRIVGASPDRTKLLLARTTYASGEVSLWVDLATGEVRELDGTPGRMFTGQVPGVASTINRYVVLEDIDPRDGEADFRIVDMAAGDVALTSSRADTAAVTIALDGATVAIPRKEGIELVDLATGKSVIYAAPADSERVPTTFALSPGGSCAAGTWDLEGDDVETVLLPVDGGESIALPDAGVGGWVMSGGS